MDSKDIQFSWEELKRILEIVSEVNDYVISETANLNIVLLNLKIEDAHLKERTGIMPIANQLDKIIKSLHSRVSEMVHIHRPVLRKHLGELSYVVEKMMEQTPEE